MVEFTRDWSRSREHWPDLFSEVAGQPLLSFLEIGCFEGQATLWLLEHVLTDPSSRITVLDPFMLAGQYLRFERNVLADYSRQVVVVPDASWPGLLEMNYHDRRPFDAVYVDGSHYPSDVLADAILVWPLIRPGGMLLFDDYVWPDAPGGQDVQAGVDAFLGCYHLSGSLVGRDQLLVRKP